jgi:hypothetical protein
LPGFSVAPSRSVWQAEEAVANLPLRKAVSVRCGRQACNPPPLVLLPARACVCE